MKVKIIRSSVFETNSSSCHSLSLLKNNKEMLNLDISKFISKGNGLSLDFKKDKSLLTKINDIKKEVLLDKKTLDIYGRFYSGDGYNLSGFEEKLSYLVNEILNSQPISTQSEAEYPLFTTPDGNDDYFSYIDRNKFALELYELQYGYAEKNKFLHQISKEKLFGFGNAISYVFDIEKYHKLIKDEKFILLQSWLSKWFEIDGLKINFILFSDHGCDDYACFDVMKSEEACFNYLFNDDIEVKIDFN